MSWLKADGEVGTLSALTSAYQNFEARAGCRIGHGRDAVAAGTHRFEPGSTLATWPALTELTDLRVPGRSPAGSGNDSANPAGGAPVERSSNVFRTDTTGQKRLEEGSVPLPGIRRRIQRKTFGPFGSSRNRWV